MFIPNKRALSAATVIAALSVPSIASARLDLNPGPAPAPTHQKAQTEPSWLAQLEAYQRSVENRFGPTPGALAGPAVRAPSPGVNPVRSTHVSSQEGFQWGDAGIGAAGIVALLGLSAGSVTAITRRRTHATRVS